MLVLMWVGWVYIAILFSVDVSKKYIFWSMNVIWGYLCQSKYDNNNFLMSYEYELQYYATWLLKCFTTIEYQSIEIKL